MKYIVGLQCMTKIDMHHQYLRQIHYIKILQIYPIIRQHRPFLLQIYPIIRKNITNLITNTTFNIPPRNKSHTVTGPSQQSMNAPKPMYNNIIIPPADINNAFDSNENDDDENVNILYKLPINCNVTLMVLNTGTKYVTFILQHQNVCFLLLFKNFFFFWLFF